MGSRERGIGAVRLWVVNLGIGICDYILDFKIWKSFIWQENNGICVKFNDEYAFRTSFHFKTLIST